MDSVVWITGNVGCDVEYRTFADEVPYATFRVASTPRYRRSGEWVDGETTWISVTCARSLAENVRASVKKGEAVVVVGKLRTNRWKDADGVAQERLTIEASAIGHDLTRGVSTFKRASRAMPDEKAGVAEMLRATESRDEAKQADVGSGGEAAA
jgi:single-strand DNA-binding protein